MNLFLPLLFLAQGTDDTWVITHANVLPMDSERVLADHAVVVEGRVIERVGFFNPSARGQEERLLVDGDRSAHWQGLGAQLSDRVAKLVKDSAAVAA